MEPTRAILFALDLVAIGILTFVLYFPRHRRKDMIVAYLTANIGVVAVADVLASSTVGAGLGLGLFGILSIIRLRSEQLDQAEVAYYFAALALGLLAGVSVSPSWVTPTLMVAVIAVLWIGDHPALFPRHRIQVINLDRAFTDEAELASHLQQMLGARIHQVTVRKVDLVNDTTSVEVRFEQPVQTDTAEATPLTKMIGGRS
ncbi:MAG: DUF4956 domain-containing protein [Coriobacteriia bacterium]|nr:DUF4956 domain-containing protein [Coriobacteriia bacterium]MBN2821653.1 DUF4956 domain-containing protein [Coriobacteriia bacterium]